MKNQKVKYALIFFVILLLLCFTACGEPKEEKSSVPVQLSEVIDLANQSHEDLMATAKQISDMKQYTVDDGSYRLTSEEINTIFSNHEAKSILTRDEALEDVRLAFKALRNGYSALYYIGVEKFDEAEANLCNELSKIETITADELKSLIKENMFFMMDGHSYIAEAHSQALYWYAEEEFFKEDGGVLPHS